MILLKSLRVKKPKTFKLNDENDIGITKNHIGFIADEIETVIPNEFENLVNENDKGIKMLNYVKLSSVCGVLQES